MAPGTEATVERINAVVLGYGELQGSFVRNENRDQLHSFLFDVPRRSLVGYEVIYEHGPWLLREVLRRSTAAQIGERMRRAAVRPGYLQLTMLPCGYLSARQLRLIARRIDPYATVVDDRHEDLALLCAFTAEASAAYRGGAIPPPGGDPHPILPPRRLTPLASALREVDAADLARARLLSATAATYALLLHGEQRDGITGHGPYESSDGCRLLCVEYTDLRNSFLPWAPGPDAVSVDGLSFVYELPGFVQARHDPYGSLAVEPPEFAELVTRMRVFARRGPSLAPLGAEEIVALQQELADARDRLYGEIVGWPDEMRVRYGGWIFANHLHAFAAAAGLGPDIDTELARRARATSERIDGELRRSGEMPDLYRHFREDGAPLFTPVR
jgi:hypothetical protein